MLDWVFLEEVADKAGSEESALDVNEILHEVLQSVRTHLGLEIAFIAEFAEGRRVFRHVDAEEGMQLIEVGDDGPLEESYCLRVLDGRLPGLIRDAAMEPAALELPVTLSLPVGAHLSVPIHFSDGRVYGTFCAFSTVPDPSLNERDLNVMRLFAGFAGKQIEKVVRASSRKEGIRERIAKVLASKNFEIHYQPIHKLSLNRIVGFEALTRFKDTPLRPPDVWFQEAATVGLQEALEMAVIARACEDLGRLPEDAYLSLNVSPGTLVGGRLVALLDTLPAHRIVLELTEHASIADYPLLQERREALRGKGVRLAVDDAGAGYASFRHILMLKPEIVKLDRSLISNIDNQLDRRALAAALIRFGEETGSKIIAEGVETAEELETLKRLNVDKAQGYLLGRPMPLERLLERGRKAPPRH